MTTFRSSFLLVILLFCLGLPQARGQVAFGSGQAGAGGIVPRLSSGVPYLGNLGFGYTIQDALGGALGVMAFSTARGSLLLGNTEILVSTAPQDFLFLDFIPLSGTPGMPGAGSGFYASPLFSTNPALLGLEFFVQAAVADTASGSFAATQGLRVETRLPPLLFMVASGNQYFLDPTNLTPLFPTETGQTPGANDALFLDGGRTLYVSGSSIRQADMTGPTPVWSTFYTPSSGNCRGVRFDQEHQILYTLADGGSGTRELLALDANPNSSTFGTLLASSSTSSGFNNVYHWDLSEFPRFAALAQSSTGSSTTGTLDITDMDPQSPAYLQVSVSTNILQNIVFGNSLTVVDTNISPNGRFANVAFQVLLGGDVSRFDRQTGTWVPSNVSTCATINSMDLSQDSHLLLVGGAASSFVASVAGCLQTTTFNGQGGAAPSNTVFTFPPVQNSQAPTQQATHVKLSPDGALAAATYSESGGIFFGIPTTFHVGIWDTTSGTLQTSLSLGTSSPQLVAWR